MFVSTNGGNDGFPNTSATSGIYASSVLVSPADPTIAWAGSSNKVWLCTDLNAPSSHWTAHTLGGAGSVNGLATDPSDPSLLWAATSGGKHYFQSTDSGKTWTTPATNFPNVSCNSIARDPANGILYIGTDFGVVYSLDKGVTWQTYGAGMPTVQILSLKVKTGSNGSFVLASTFGRGNYYTPAAHLGVATNQAALPASFHPIYPNPTSQSAIATIGFNLVKGGVTFVTLHDMIGREVLTIAKENMTAGEHTLTLNTSGLAPGNYICALTNSGITLTQKIEIVR
jgi:hypothetical protein